MTRQRCFCATPLTMNSILQKNQGCSSCLPCNYCKYDSKNNPQPPRDVDKRLQPTIQSRYQKKPQFSKLAHLKQNILLTSGLRRSIRDSPHNFLDNRSVCKVTQSFKKILLLYHYFSNILLSPDSRQLLCQYKSLVVFQIEPL